MKFKYIGDDKQPPQSIVCFGYAFELHGPAVEVDEATAGRLQAIRTFRKATGGRPKANPEADQSAEGSDNGTDQSADS